MTELLPTLSTAIAFLRGAVARNLHGSAPSLYTFHGGWVHAWGAASVAMAAHPCPLQGTFALDADTLDAALKRMRGEPVISAGENSTLVFKSGRLRSELDVLYADPVDPPAEVAWEPVPDGLLDAVTLAADFVAPAGDDRAWMTGILLSDRVRALNGRSGVEVEVAGLDVPPVIIPPDTAKYLASLGAPSQWVPRGGTTLYFRWPNGAFVRHRTIDAEWPDVAFRAMDSAGDDAPVAIDDELREAIADVAALGDGSIILRPEGLTARRVGSKVAVDIECGVTRQTEWAQDVLAPVMRIADRWNPDAEGGTARFLGKNLRGLVAGIRR